MVDLSDPQTQVLLFIPLGALALLLLHDKDEEEPEQQTVYVGSKEERFLRYNQDGVYGNVLAAEEHFRNVAADKRSSGFLSCIVKHLSLASNHAGEAISHTVAVGDTKDSAKYRELNEKIVELQHDVQDNKVTLEKGIERTREIRNNFEAFNPSYDISKCKACTL